VGWVDINTMTGIGAQPSAEHAAAWEHQRMSPLAINHGKFE
jgi:hypothetical protein